MNFPDLEGKSNILDLSLFLRGLFWFDFVCIYNFYFYHFKALNDEHYGLRKGQVGEGDVVINFLYYFVLQHLGTISDSLAKHAFPSRFSQLALGRGWSYWTKSSIGFFYIYFVFQGKAQVFRT